MSQKSLRYHLPNHDSAPGASRLAPKLGKRITARDASDFVALIRALAEEVPDPTQPPPARSPDPDDDYLIALAAREQVHIVSGEAHLLGLGVKIPVVTPSAALDLPG